MTVALVGVLSTSLGFWVTFSQFHPRTALPTLVGQLVLLATGVEKSVAAVSVPALAALCTVAVLFAEEHRDIRAPACLSAQITAGLLLDIVKCICCFHRGEVYSGSIATVVAIIRLALLALELLSRWDFFAYTSTNELQTGVDISALWKSFIVFLNQCSSFFAPISIWMN